MPTVQSFDVFDTLLTRHVGEPSAVVHVLGKRLESDNALPVRAAVFVAARNEYERTLNSRLDRHATLREIYRAVAEALSVDAARADMWALAEEDVDRTLTVAVPGAVDRVEAARARGPVVFVSDTPHSEAFVKELLVDHGVARVDELVFTSSERRVSKSQGGLFRAVREEFGGDQLFHHVGDNRRSDVAAARVEGWSATFLPEGRLTRYERLLEARAEATDGLTSWVAGASRLARLEARQRGVPAPQAEVASGVLGPLLVGFALWVVDQARQRGVRRLYYVARDGEVMLTAARHIIGAVAPDLELRYLHGSRKPWIFGATATSDEFLRDWVVAKPDYTARTLLARVDLTPEQVFDVADLVCCSAKNRDTALSPKDRLELADALQRDPLLALVRERAALTADQTLRYLEQEGLTQDVPTALVDAGWGGRTAHAFDHLQRQAHGPQVHHFFMGIKAATNDLNGDDAPSMVPWLFDEQRFPSDRSRLPNSQTLVEVLCAGTVGRTLGYEVVGGASRPVLAADSNEPVLAWGLREVHRTAERVAELVALNLPRDSSNIDTSEAVLSVLRTFWVQPTRAEAEAWGTFPLEEEIWPPFAPLAARITTREVGRRLLRGDRQIRRVHSWRAGSAITSSQPWRTLLRVRGWQVDNRARLRRIPRRLRMELAVRRRP